MELNRRPARERCFVGTGHGSDVARYLVDREREVPSERRRFVSCLTTMLCMKGKTLSAVLSLKPCQSADHVPPMISWMWPCAPKFMDIVKSILRVSCTMAAKHQVTHTLYVFSNVLFRRSHVKSLRTLTEPSSPKILFLEHTRIAS